MQGAPVVDSVTAEPPGGIGVSEAAVGLAFSWQASLVRASTEPATAHPSCHCRLVRLNARSTAVRGAMTRLHILAANIVAAALRRAERICEVTQ